MTLAYYFLRCAVSFFIFNALGTVCVGSGDIFPGLSSLKSKTPVNVQRKAVEDLIFRKLNNRSKEFIIVINPALGTEYRNTFKLETNSSEGVVTIQGNNGVSASWGFHFYMTRYVNDHISWDGEQLNLPHEWPQLPDEGLTMTSNDKFHYAENTCTLSYSYPWYDWSAWEKHIDWLALNAVNLPLAVGGQEEIWMRVFVKFGLTKEDVLDYFTGPAFLAWNRMGNIRGWGGKLSMMWITKQASIQFKILKRMRDFSMLPVLPAFAGFVPVGFSRVFPDAKINMLPSWNKFNGSYSSNFLLDSKDPLFVKIGQAFLKEYVAEFGTDHVYSADTFNEMSSFGDPDFIASYGRAVYDAMTSADDNATWIMQGWIFQDEKFWNESRAKALLTSVPIGKMIVLDLFAEERPRYMTYKFFYGQPFIWCMLHNFGGRSSFYGAIEQVNKGPLTARNLNDSTMVGIGFAPESINQNYIIYEFFLEHVWVKEERNVDDWVEKYVGRRYGIPHEDVTLAWKKLIHSVYNYTSINRLKSHMFTDRPNLHMKSNYWYSPLNVLEAWDLFLAFVDKNKTMNQLFEHDLVDLSRQAMEIIIMDVYQNMSAAYHERNVDKFLHFNQTFISALMDLDLLLATDPKFLLGRWLSDARKSANGEPGLDDLFEFNARNQITLWGPRGNVLDYAAKQWSGLIKGYYVERWKLFAEELVRNWGSFNQTSFNDKVFKKVELPFNYDTTTYPNVPHGNPIKISIMLHRKYRKLFE